MTPAINLPDGRSVALGPDVQRLLLCGVLVAESVRVGQEASLTTEIAVCTDRLREEYAGKQPAEIAGLQEARRLYRSVGMDPTRYRPSSEALLRRLLQGRPLYIISNAVDACNLASMSFLLPIGLYDLDRVQGDVTLRLGGAGQEYPGIRKSAVHLTDRLGLFDSAGPFGSPSSDSARTSVSDQTERLLAVIMATATYPPDAMGRNLGLLADLFNRHCHATIEYRAVMGGEGAGS